MSDNTKISWSDASWNPVSGCTEVSPGCAHCYAKTFAERWRGVPGNYYENGFDVQLRPNMLDRPLHWKKPRRIFVNSMSDLFHEDVPDEYIDKVFAVMALTPQHTYQLLTKRIERALEYLAHPDVHQLSSNRITDATRHFPLWPDVSMTGVMQTGEWPLRNVLIGPTVENQHFAYARLPVLKQLHEMHWRTMVSYEPALGPVDFDLWSDGTIDWLICGGESGDKRRPFDIEWARDARDFCRFYRIPFFMKQDGAFRSEVYDTLPDDLKVREFPR